MESESRWSLVLYKLPVQEVAEASGGLPLDGSAGVSVREGLSASFDRSQGLLFQIFQKLVLLAVRVAGKWIRRTVQECCVHFRSGCP